MASVQSYLQSHRPGRTAIAVRPGRETCQKVKLQACKPDSVPDSACRTGPLSFIWPRLHRRGLSAYPPASGEQPSSAGVHGISTHRVFPISLLPDQCVRSYRTFSPLPWPRGGREVLLSVALSVLRPKPKPHPLGGVALCVVRTFLPPARGRKSDRAARASTAKLTEKSNSTVLSNMVSEEFGSFIVLDICWPLPTRPVIRIEAALMPTLYLLPAPLGPDALHTLSPYAISLMHRLEYFIAERAKTARHFLKRTNLPHPISTLTIYELDKRTPPSEWQRFLDPALQGHDIGLLSEAGMPGIADPGSRIVTLAHETGIRVEPVTGPSSILLALIASGLSGQNFCFHGYLPAKRSELTRQLSRLESLSKRFRQTQIFMETPYRNTAVVQEALNTLNPDTRFGIACDLTLPTEYIMTRTVSHWKKKPPPDLHKRPSIFLIGHSNG